MELALRGKSIALLGSSVVNDIKVSYPELFPYASMEQLSLVFPAEIELSITSGDHVDTDYKTIAANNTFSMTDLSFSNLKIKSVTIQTGYIYTAGT